MKYVIWGAGLRGRRLFSHLDKNDIFAFVDKNEQKIGTFFCEKKVISLDDYLEKFKGTMLVISHTFEEKAMDELRHMGIETYMRLSDCPSEFQSDSTSAYLKKYVQSLVNINCTYGILGCSIYGLEVYSWLLEIGCKSVYMIIQEDVPISMVHLIEKNGYCTVKECDVSPKYIDTVLNCIYTERDVEINRFKGCKQIDIFDCTDVIEEYYNPEIEKLKNIYTGECCVIVATGPSLKISDLALLEQKHIFTFGVNKIGYAYNSTKWRPTYYVGEDKALLESQYFQDIKPEKQSKISFVSDTSESFWKTEHDSGILKFHLCDGYVYNRHPKFSENASRKIYEGGTVVYTCFQFAVYMGFKEIYLLGVDFTGANEHGSRYSHFYKETELTSVSYTDQVKSAYEKAKKYADDHGIKIYNATRGGRLEIFPRVDFDTIFQKRLI